MRLVRSKRGPDRWGLMISMKYGHQEFELGCTCNNGPPEHSCVERPKRRVLKTESSRLSGLLDVKIVRGFHKPGGIIYGVWSTEFAVSK